MNKNIIFMLLLLQVFTINGQVPTDILQTFHNYYYEPQNLGLSAPQVSDLIKYGGVNVNCYNGLLDLNIQLNGYKDKDFEIPISLRYISNGFIPAKRPSFVGNNWILNFGGVITRTVHGSPDDNRGLYNNNDGKKYIKDGILVAIRDGRFKHYSESELVNFNLTKNTNNTPYVSGDLQYDFEPDIFRFSFGSHSGTFIIGNNGIVTTSIGDGYKIDISGLSIQAYSTTQAPSSSTIKIITPDGYIYEFGGDISSLEYCIPNNPENSSKIMPRYITSWFLKSIKASNNRVANFTYRSVVQKNKYNNIFSSWVNSYVRTSTCGGFHPMIPNSLIAEKIVFEDKTYSPVIEKVSVDNGSEIIFDIKQTSAFYENDDFSLCLNSIIQKYGTEIVNKHTFEYQISGKYFFLKKLIKNDHKYQFDYNLNMKLPEPLTLSLDHWGFWNGGYDIRLDTKEDVAVHCLNLNDLRAVNTSVCDITLLNKVTYPTGGIVEVIYEHNRYNKYLERSMDEIKLIVNTLTSSVPCGGSRVKSIKETDRISTESNLRTFKYNKINQTLGSGIIGVLPKYLITEKMESTITETKWENGFAKTCIMNIMNTIEDRSSNSYNSNNILDEYHIGYSEVIEQFSDGGYIEYAFTSFNDVPDDVNVTNDVFMRAQHRSLLGKIQIIEKIGLYKANDLSHFRGRLISKKFFSSTNKMVKTESFSYNLPAAKSKYNISVRSAPRGIASYKFFLVPCLLLGVKVTDANNIIVEEEFKYNDIYLKSEEKKINSDNSKIAILYKYPLDFLSNETYRKMIERNIINKVVEKTMLKDNSFLQKHLTTYKLWNSLFFAPERVEIQTKKGSLEIRESYIDYDNKGNPLHIVKADYSNVVYIWGYCYQYPIAEISNATYAQVVGCINETILAGIAAKKIPSPSDITLINGLRSKLPNAQVISYTYEPLVGMTSKTLPNGITTYYEYDAFGRLMHVKDHKGKILESHDYHYRH